jgi:hypothetical protein
MLFVLTNDTKPTCNFYSGGLMGGGRHWEVGFAFHVREEGEVASCG